MSSGCKTSTNRWSSSTVLGSCLRCISVKMLYLVLSNQALSNTASHIFFDLTHSMVQRIINVTWRKNEITKEMCSGAYSFQD